MFAVMGDEWLTGVQMHAKHSCKVYIEKTYPVEGINDMLEHYKQKSLKGRLCMTF